MVKMKRKLYRFVLKMILKDQEIGLTGKQKSQVESLIKKCEKKGEKYELV